jgi:cysteine desulfurase
LLPIPEIATLVEEFGGTLHTDAVQAIGKVPVSAADPGIHLLTSTAHKIYGPRGTGLLYIREGTEIEPLLHGGGQEGALRPGTEDVAGAVAFATALRLAVDEQAEEAQRLTALRDAFEDRVLAEITDVRINAGAAPRSPSISSLGIDGADGGLLLNALDLEGIATSGGSACASGTNATSHVIRALFGPDDTKATVRFSMGRHSSEADVSRAASVLAEVVARMRSLAQTS